MILPVILVLISVVALLALLRFARGRHVPPSPPEALLKSLQAVDLEAFRNLMDPDEELFLKVNLPPADFRLVQRKRLRAAVGYLRGASHNAAVLLRLGEAAARSTEPELAAAGQRLVDNALRLRLHALFSIILLYAKMILPMLPPLNNRLADRYEQLCNVSGQIKLFRTPGGTGGLPVGS